MNNNSVKDSITTITSKSIKDDLLHFKNEVLIDFNKNKKEIENKFSISNDFITQKFLVFESRINAYEKKISELTILCQSNQKFTENINSLLKFKEETLIELTQNKTKTAENEYSISNEFSRINAILKNTVIYPEIIGLTSKFQNFHSLIDYILNEIGKLNKFRDANNIIDFPVFKKKIEIAVDYMKTQLDKFDENIKKFAIQTVAESEERLKNMIKVFNDRLQDSRIENASYAIKIEKRSEELLNMIEYMKKLEKEFSNYNLKNDEVKNSMIKNTIEMNSIKEKIKKIILMIAELKLRIPNKNESNLNTAYMQVEINKILEEKKPKQKTKIVSGVKRYIEGLINGEELSSMSRFVIGPDGKPKKKLRKNSFVDSDAEFNNLNKPKNDNLLSLYRDNKITKFERRSSGALKINHSLNKINNVNNNENNSLNNSKTLSNCSDSSNHSIHLNTKSKNSIHSKNESDHNNKSNSYSNRSKTDIKKSQNVIKEEDENENSEESRKTNRAKKNNKAKDYNEEKEYNRRKEREVKKIDELKNKEINSILTNYNNTTYSTNNILNSEKEKEKNKIKNYFNNTMTPKIPNVLQNKKLKHNSMNLNNTELSPIKKFSNSNPNNLKTIHNRISYQPTENNINNIALNKFQNNILKKEMLGKSASSKDEILDKKNNINLEIHFNKTYSNFPKVMNNSLFIDNKKSITYKNIRLNQTPKISLTKSNKQKKVLLINPEDIPANYAWIKKQVMEGNKTNNNSIEKNLIKKEKIKMQFNK